MIVLGVDTTTVECSVALWHDGKNTVRSNHSTNTQHAESLLPLIQNLLSETKTNLHDIDRFGVVVGPGSFSGIRTGIAALLGFRLVTQKEIRGFSKFETFAHTVPLPQRKNKMIVVVLEGKYVQVFSETLTAHTPPRTQDWKQTIHSLLPELRHPPLIVADHTSLSSEIIAHSPNTFHDHDASLSTITSSVSVLCPNVSPAATVAMLAATHPSSLPIQPLYLKDRWSKKPNAPQPK